MRKDRVGRFDGLCGLVDSELGRVATSGEVFIFLNRRRTHLKILHWEPGGFVLYHKRLESGTFPTSKKPGSGSISWSELVHREPISIFLKPTLLLMSAPFEVGFLSYVSQVKHIDLFASVMFYFGFFIFIVLFFIVFTKNLPFMISWWRACFSVGALTNASLRYAILSQDLMVKDLAVFMLVLASVLILITFLLTLRLQINGKLLRP